MLKWDNGCPWDSQTTDGAATNGYLAVLKFAWENGCPVTASTPPKLIIAKSFKVLTWWVDNKLPIVDELVCACAASGGSSFRL